MPPEDMDYEDLERAYYDEMKKITNAHTEIQRNLAILLKSHQKCKHSMRECKDSKHLIFKNEFYDLIRIRNLLNGLDKEFGI